MKTVAELEERLARPGVELIEMMKRLDGDIMILGIGGKMGPTMGYTWLFILLLWVRQGFPQLWGRPQAFPFWAAWEAGAYRGSSC